MNILSLANFKSLRKQEGTWYAIYSMLAKANICEYHADHFVEGISIDLGRRTIEKMKSKDVYDIVDGFLLAVQEHSPITN